ncbi:uncharacterized protein RHO25_000637 [Cercospora beticola]|uniref:BRCT domain-containing protein n=1 Tax=Cercospora beticola TaxID=122368 RepID=A0ABZ0N939_CERBT|nr:hypothetical protein RHO25_000637 [Cercospora beticola]CAK1355694.1 unnamed protein product [Cercospora beticola]
MATPSTKPPAKYEYFARDSETDSDGDDLNAPHVRLEKRATSKDTSPSTAVDRRDGADSSFHTQATQPLETPVDATRSNSTTLHSPGLPVDDEAFGLNEQREVGEPQDNDAEDGTPSIAPEVASRGLKRKLTARADQYEFPGDADSDAQARRNRTKLPKAARDSEDDGEDTSSAPPTATKKLDAVFEAVRTANGEPNESKVPAPSPTQSSRQSAGTQTSTEHHEDAEEVEMADAEDEAEAATVSPPFTTAKKGGRPPKAALMDNGEPDDDEESTDAGDDEIAPAVQSDQPLKKRGRGRPPKASRVNGEPDDDEESTDAGDDEIAPAVQSDQPLKKRGRGRPPKASRVNGPDAPTSAAAGKRKTKPRKSLRSTTTAATPAKQVLRRQTATPSATVRRTPKILLSASGLPPAAKAWMTRNKIKSVDETPSKGTNYVCVTRDKALPRTLKVLQSLVAGKTVVGDSWINDSRKEGELLDADDYLHADLKDIEADPATRRSLFAQKTLFFTVKAATFYEDWDKLVELANEAGAAEILKGNANKGHATTPKESVIFFGENNATDDDAEDLIKTHGRVVYDKTAFAQWIINAEVDLDDSEYVLTSPLQGSQAKNGGAGKKAKK